MSEIAVCVRLEAAEGFAEALAARIAEAVTEALARQTVLMAAQMRLGNADAVLRAQSDAAMAAAQSAAVAETPAPVVKTAEPVVKMPASAEAASAEPPALRAPASMRAREEPAKPAASNRPEKKWTAERDALLKALKARGDSWAEIHQAVNNLAGAPVASADSCMVHWHDLKRSGKLHELPVVKLPSKNAKKPVEKTTSPIKVSHETARHWAGERGLVTGTDALDITKVNAKRHDLGLSPFEIVTEGGRRLPA